MPSTKAKSDNLVLYCHPMSFYSQIARLALEEKELPYKAVIVDIGPAMENYEPWYMRMNPRGVVPTLDHDGKIVTDSFRIMKYVDELPSTAPRLIPEEAADQKAMDVWLEKLNAFPTREFSYSHISGIIGKLARRSFVIRRRALEKGIEQAPELRENYEARLRDVDSWEQTIVDDKKVAALEKDMSKLLDELEKTLEKQTWAAGSTYSLADVVWTIFLARIAMVKPGLLKNRPNIQGYNDRLKRRPSYQRAGIGRKPGIFFKLRTIRKALPKLLRVK